MTNYNFKHILMKIQNSVFNIETFFFTIAALPVAYATFLAFFYGNQLPLDDYSFRQSQTALTAYWFVQDGLKLDYETPVLGIPWSIPFEFPIYQAIVATLSKFLGLPLDFTGRITSYIFLILCLIPSRSIIKKLQLSNLTFYIFCAILFSSPIYVYWGRTFMIETTALFFTIVAIKYFIDGLYDDFGYKNISLYATFMTLAILQKATTALPVIIILLITFMFLELKKNEFNYRLILSRRFFLGIIGFAIPIVIGFAWVSYTDQLKSLNPSSLHLVSSNLTTWNWGTVAQRISLKLYTDVIWQRIFITNLAGILGLILLLAAIFIKIHWHKKSIIFLSIALGMMPLFLFTNLHLVHTYYQTANVIFLISAVSVALSTAIYETMGIAVTGIMLILILSSNYFTLYNEYLQKITDVFTKENRHLAVGSILKRELEPNAQFVAFGNDWSSTFSYISQRKSLTVPNWLNYKKVVSNPEVFVEKGHLGAVVSCSDNLSLKEIIEWSKKSGKLWKIGKTHGCYIVTPQKSLMQPLNVPIHQCTGNIDDVAIQNRNGLKLIVFSGWTTISNNSKEIPQNIFIVISKQGTDIMTIEALKVPKLDVNKYLNISNDIDAGFSSIIPATLAVGYEMRVVQSKGNFVETCQYKKKFTVTELSHENVLDKIHDIDPPRDLMAFVHEVTLGDKWGTLKPQGLGTFFVHPGATTVTAFQFDVNGYLGNSTKRIFNIHAHMAPNVPEAAVKRGAANVRLQILQGETALVDGIVKVGEPIQRNLSVADKLPLRFIIDNNGNADTDWLLLSIH